MGTALRRKEAGTADEAKRILAGKPCPSRSDLPPQGATTHASPARSVTALP